MFHVDFFLLLGFSLTILYGRCSERMDARGLYYHYYYYTMVTIMCKLADFQCTNNNNRVILIIIKRRQPLLPHEMHIKFPIIRILRVCVCVWLCVGHVARCVLYVRFDLKHCPRRAHCKIVYNLWWLVLDRIKLNVRTTAKNNNSNHL